MVIKKQFNLAVLFLCLLSLNCVSHTNCEGLDNIKDTFLSITHQHNQTLLPYDSFVKLVKEVTDKDGNPYMTTSASGVVISHSETETIILTAKHFCENRIDLSQIPEELQPINVDSFVIDVDKIIHTVKSVSVDEFYDICAVTIEKIEQQAVVISPVAPRRGEKVFNIAAPLGITDGRAILLFEGYYAGVTEASIANTKTAFYSIPIKSGSSGSAILNEHGELVGIVYAGVKDFENICFSIPFEQLVLFLQYQKIIEAPTHSDP